MTYPVVSLRRLARVINGGTPTPDASNWGGEVAWATPVDLGRAGFRIATTDRTLTDVGLASGSRTVPAGSVLLSTRAPIGHVAIADERMAFNQGCRGLVPYEDVDCRYLAYQLLAKKDHLQAAGQGSTFMELSGDALASVRLCKPSLEEQRRIAGFLDDRTQALDEAADAHARLLELLDERIDSAIGEFIVPALAQRAGHEMLPIKRLLSKLARPVDVNVPVVTAFRDGQVIARRLRRAEGYTETRTDSASMQGVENGDVVIHGLDGFAGAVGTSESSGVCSPANHVCVPRLGGDADFYGRMLRIFATSGYLSLYGGSARERAVDFRNWATFSRIPLPVVPLPRQREIGEMVVKVRRLRAETGRLFELLAERKQTLIAAAVSGEFDVTTARSVA